MTNHEVAYDIIQQAGDAGITMAELLAEATKRGKSTQPGNILPCVIRQRDGKRHGPCAPCEHHGAIMVERNGRLYLTGSGQRYGGQSRSYVVSAERAARPLTTNVQKVQLLTAVPTGEELRKIHEEYRRTVLNNYATTIPRIDAALSHRNTEELATATAEWLKDLNRQYYRFRPGEAATLTQKLKPILQRELETVLSFCNRSIKTLTKSDEVEVFRLFGLFRTECGPVGAGKALHVLAPKFFPLWDNGIAQSYGVSTESGYFQFMNAVKAQVLNLPEEIAPGVTALKVLDEWNYLRTSAVRRAAGGSH